MKRSFLERLTNAYSNIPFIPEAFRSICQEDPISRLYNFDGIVEMSSLTWTIFFSTMTTIKITLDI